MDTTEYKTEAAVVAALATGTIVERDGIFYAVSDGSIISLDTEKFGLGPRRPRGTIKTLTPMSFIAEVERRKSDEITLVAADPRQELSIEAILNDLELGEPGWRDHRVSLAIDPTPEFAAWVENAKPVAFATFARFIQDNYRDISGGQADMLEVARKFTAAVNVTAVQGADRRTGSRELEITARATATSVGSGGTTELPDGFDIVVQVYDGTDAVQIHCDLDFTVADSGAVTMGYRIDRPDLIKKSVAEQIIAEVEQGLGEKVSYGSVPTYR